MASSEKSADPRFCSARVGYRLDGATTGVRGCAESTETTGGVCLVRYRGRGACVVANQCRQDLLDLLNANPSEPSPVPLRPPRNRPPTSS